MTTKQLYTAPTAEPLVVQAEGMICFSNPMVLQLNGTFGITDAAGAEMTLDDGYAF